MADSVPKTLTLFKAQNNRQSRHGVGVVKADKARLGEKERHSAPFIYEQFFM